jgi:hypothetical protein
MMENKITMSNRNNEVCINTTGDCSTCMIPKVGTCNHDRYHDYINKKEGNDMDAFTTPNNTINIVLQVNPELLIGKTYQEIVEALAKTIIQNNVSVEGEKPFPMEYGKFYDINQKGIIKRATVDELDGLIVALDVPFIQTDNPTLDSICVPEPPIEEDDFDDYYDILDSEYTED